MTELGDTPWVDRTWKAVWARAAARVDESWLPDVRDGKKFRVHEHGKGSWGVVSPTNELGVVVKLTTDPSEALFVSWILSIDPPEEGLIGYRQIYELGGYTFRNRKIYALWRDEAWHVGDPIVNLRPAANLPMVNEEDVRNTYMQGIRGLVLIDEVRRLCMPFRETLQRQRRALDDVAYRELLERLWSAYVNGGSRNMRAHELAMRLHQIRIKMEETATSRFCAGVGKAMLHCLRKGVVLADVHKYNIGIDHPAAGSWVITDPGHAVVVNPAVVIPPIEAL